jgi:V/A-type H+-transporting ATPase subunit B
MDKLYLKFASTFEGNYVSQGEYEDRSIERTLDLGWELLSVFPTVELKRIRQKWLDKYLPRFKKVEDGEAEAVAGAEAEAEAGAAG